MPASLAIDAQQFAYDHMAKKLASQITKSSGAKMLRLCDFLQKKCRRPLIPYLGLDDTRRLRRLKPSSDRRKTDADMTNSKCAYRNTDPESRTDLRSVQHDAAPNRPTIQSVRSRFLKGRQPYNQPKRMLTMYNCAADVLAHHDEKGYAPSG